MSRNSGRRLPIGAEVRPGGGTDFRVWAPRPAHVALVVDRGVGSVVRVALEDEAAGYYSAFVPEVTAGDRYRYLLDGVATADPASRFQPDGPFGWSQVVDPHAFAWTDATWSGVRLPGQVIYEMHVGTFSPEGTWQGAAKRLPEIADVGVTVIELMPVSEFPGEFGWGYDGVFPFAPTRLYGAPDDLRSFVNAAHRLGLAVILDVVYNHLGPDGCVFSRYAHGYFSTRYDNEWGDPLNFDGEQSGPVREYFTHNAAYWIDEYHLDGLRLDATQSIHDASDEHVVALVARRARAAARGRDIILVAENERQDARLVRCAAAGGFGLDALWNDDFHHSAAVAVTGRREAYYTDHHGAPQEFISAAKRGYLFQGQRYEWQRRSRGTRTRGIEPPAFVIFIENHDQVANSGDGSRMHQRTSPGRYRALTAMMLLMPGTPMLFQGQEFGASAPFLFFADHNPELATAVQKGRGDFMRQFPSLASADMQARLPPPDDRRTFERCRLDWRERDLNRSHLRLHRDLLSLRRSDLAFLTQKAGAVDGAVLSDGAFALHFAAADVIDERLLIVNFGADLTRGSFAEPLVAPPERCEWEVRWSSECADYGGIGTPEVVGEHGWRIPGHAAIVLRPVSKKSAQEPPEASS